MIDLYFVVMTLSSFVVILLAPGDRRPFTVVAQAKFSDDKFGMSRISFNVDTVVMTLLSKVISFNRGGLGQARP